MDFFTQHGGPLALQAIDGLKEDSGAEIELNDQAWTRGMICQIGDPDVAEITGSDPQGADGPFAHGSIPNAVANEADFGFLGVVTSASVPEDSDGNVFVKGLVQAAVLTDDAETTLTFGAPLYAVEGQTFLVTSVDPTINTVSYTTIRAVASMMETRTGLTQQTNYADIKVLFNGIPPHLG